MEGEANRPPDQRTRVPDYHGAEKANEVAERNTKNNQHPDNDFPGQRTGCPRQDCFSERNTPDHVYTVA
jgi:hypothetical protein